MSNLLSDLQQTIKSLIKVIPDYPKEGVMFQDITPVLENPAAFIPLIHYIGTRYNTLQWKESNPSKGIIHKIAAVESRGFVFGAALAFYLEVGLVLLRKPGKLPRERDRQDYKSEYKSDALEVHLDSIRQGEHFILCDDMLAEGGTALNAALLIERQKAHITEIICPFEIKGLGGRAKLEDSGYSVYSFCTL